MLNHLPFIYQKGTDMGKALYDYTGYGSNWLNKNKITPSFMKSFGIKTDKKTIDTHLKYCSMGYVETGGMGYIKHVEIFDLKELCNRLKRYGNIK